MFSIKLQSEYDDLDKYKNIVGDIWYCKKNRKMYHNPYGSAIISKDGYKSYLINGKWHRIEGPAAILIDGTEQYWINNDLLTKEQFEMDQERLKYLGKGHLICLT